MKLVGESTVLFLSWKWNNTTSSFWLPICENGMGFGLCGLGIPKPHNMPSMFGSWLFRIPREYKPLVLLGAAVLCWSVWLYRNIVVFDNKKSSFLQVIYSTTHWLCKWTILQKLTLQDKLVAASHFLAQVAKDFFARAHGWRSSLRIDSH